MFLPAGDTDSNVYLTLVVFDTFLMQVLHAFNVKRKHSNFN